MVVVFIHEREEYFPLSYLLRFALFHYDSFKARDVILSTEKPDAASK